MMIVLLEYIEYVTGSETLHGSVDLLVEFQNRMTFASCRITLRNFCICTEIN